MINKLQNQRNEAGLSQAELSNKVNVSLMTLRKYEREALDINGAKLSTLLKLCLALDCTLSDILNDEETLELLRKYEAK